MIAILPAFAYQTTPWSVTPSPTMQIAQASLSSSFNWAGYIANNGTFTGVGATWTIPKTNNNSGTLAADATWVGIGGTTSRDLIQVGTQTITSPTGDVSYKAWIEKLPSSSRVVFLTVNPGDSITASIIQQSDGLWNISLTDNTTGQKFQTTTQYNSSLSSAEWIQEMPSVRYGFIPLDSFGSVQFSNAWTIQNGIRVSAAQAQVTAMTMTDLYNQTLAAPSALDAIGSGFVVTRSNTANTPTLAIGRGSFRIKIRFRN